MPNEKFMCAYIANVSVSPKVIWMNNSKIIPTFKGSSFKQEDKTAFTPKNVVNLFIVYELDTWSRDLNTGFTLKDCLFGAVKLTKNADTDKCKCSRHGIGFNSQSAFSLPDCSVRKNVIIFGAAMSPCVYNDKWKYTLTHVKDQYKD